MMRSVRFLRLWLWRFFKEITIGKAVLVVVFLTAIFGIIMEIKNQEIPDHKRLQPPPHVVKERIEKERLEQGRH